MKYVLNKVFVTTATYSKQKNCLSLILITNFQSKNQGILTAKAINEFYILNIVCNDTKLWSQQFRPIVKNLAD